VNDDPWHTPSRHLHAFLKLLGSIGYLQANAEHAPAKVVYLGGSNEIEVNHVAAYVAPSSHLSHIRPIFLTNAEVSPAQGLVAKNLTGIGGGGDFIGSNWSLTNHDSAASPSGVDSIFTSSGSARLCYRYIDGMLTTTPLWPWPMNQRIINAMQSAGRNAVDVTATIEQIFGPIPSSCRAGATNPAPAPPYNVQVLP
jgi:hypothetical protein